MPRTNDTTPAVHRYLSALGAQDWDRLETALSPSVVRIGPYRDVVEGSSAYREFLERIVAQLKDYELRVERVAASDGVACVQLSETVTDESGQRLRTEEALVFDLDAQGRIARVAVYTQKSEVV